jgi:hypothetical protein
MSLLIASHMLLGVRRRQSYRYKELAVVKVHPPQTDSYVLNQGDEDSWSFEYVGEGNHVHFSQLVTRNGVAEIKYKHFV